MIIAFETYFYNGNSYTVGGVFETWADDTIKYFVTSKQEYKDGEDAFSYDISCIMQCLSLVNIDNIDTIIINGFVWLSQDGKTTTEGLGAKLNDAIIEKYGEPKNIVGISTKKHFVKIPNCYEVFRDEDNEHPLYVTCSNPDYAEHYSVLVTRMWGKYKMPTIFRLIQAKGSKFLKDSNKEDDDGLKINLNDLDEWAEKTFSKDLK